MKYIKIFLITGLCCILYIQSALPLSLAVKTKNDYNFTLNKMRKLDIVIENFGSDDNKKKYEYLKTLFQDSGEQMYGQNYSESYEKFRKLKSEMIFLLETIAQSYLERTKTILDSTATNSFNIMIKYSKHSSLGKYFRRAYDPLRDTKPYDEKNYHLFYNREHIENYLSNGYKNYHRAKNLFNDPDIDVIKNRRNLSSESLNVLIDRYFLVIDTCRDAKMYGIEIYKILNASRLGDIVIKYNIKADMVDPVFDDRIPDEYRVDANDNIGFIHSIEEKKLERYKQ